MRLTYCVALCLMTSLRGMGYVTMEVGRLRNTSPGGYVILRGYVTKGGDWYVS